ncbi:dTMP kinase, partial [Bacteroidetes/Chlorobi group bacterium ChocPot_Mid]
KLKDKIETSGDGFFKKIIDAYKILATEEPDRFVEINSEGNIQNTYEKIIEIIRKKLLINY